MTNKQGLFLNDSYGSHPTQHQGVLNRPWRLIDWSEDKEKTLWTSLNNFQPCNSEVSTLRILLHGPVGAGKSSFINTVDGVLRRRNTNRAQTNSALEGASYTLESKTFKLKKGKSGSYYPFTFTDISGIEDQGGIQTKDITKILKGHIANGYTFNPSKAISKEDQKYTRNPLLKDKIHCLVSVIPANSISRMEENVIRKMREVRSSAKDLGIPQVIIMTKVDEACPLVKENIQTIYTSKKIKEKMEECSARLGVSMNYIFPLKNHHEEQTIKTAVNILVLHALQDIVNFASDYVDDIVDSE